MDLDYWLGHMYRTGVVKKGEGNIEVKRLFKEDMANNAKLRKEAMEKRQALRVVDKARNGKDYITRQMIEILETVLEQEKQNG